MWGVRPRRDDRGLGRRLLGPAGGCGASDLAATVAGSAGASWVRPADVGRPTSPRRSRARPAPPGSGRRMWADRPRRDGRGLGRRLLGPAGDCGPTDLAATVAGSAGASWVRLATVGRPTSPRRSRARPAPPGSGWRLWADRPRRD